MHAETHSPTDVAVYARGPWAHLIAGENPPFLAQQYHDERW